MISGSEEAWTEITVFDGFRPPPPDRKLFFVLSSGCESRDLQTKPSWIYFQSERGTDDGEGGGGARFREDRVSEKMHHCFSRRKTHTKKKQNNKLWVSLCSHHKNTTWHYGAKTRQDRKTLLNKYIMAKMSRQRNAWGLALDCVEAKFWTFYFCSFIQK